MEFGYGTTEQPMKSSESRMPCILVADDQPDVLEALRFLIKGEGYLAISVNSPAAVIHEVESRDFDAVLDRKSTRLNSSHRCISYAVFCLKKKIQREHTPADLQAGSLVARGAPRLRSG